MNVDLQEFRGAFVAEAREHLAAAQGHLLAIEKAARAGQSAPRALRDLLRLLHTIKGLAAMVGVEPIVQLAHAMETTVRTTEQAGGATNATTSEALVAGSRAIEAQIRNVESDRAPSSAPADVLRALEGVEPPVRVARTELDIDPVIAAKLNASEKDQLRAGATAGRRVMRVDFAPAAEKAALGISITTVRERIGALGEIVKVIPVNTPASPTSPGGLVFTLLVITNAADVDLAAAAHVGPEAVTMLAGAATEEEAVVAEAGVDAMPSVRVDEPEDAPVEDSRTTLRVEVRRVDDAIDMLGSLIVTRARLAHAVARLEQSGADCRELRAILADNARQLRDLRSAILRVRMVPLAVALDRLPFVVRGLRRATGKDVQLVLDVGNGELDKTVAERLFPALIHLVRNAVDHGIETAAARVAAGKSPDGTIRMTSRSLDRNVEIRIADDGDGVDRARVAGKAGAPVPVTDDELLELLCRPGLSTRSEVDTTSGRGLGMDIVRKTVERLGGELVLETVPGRGTTFIVRVPLTVAIVDAFTVRCRGDRFAVPVAAVEEIIELGRLVPPTHPGGPRLLARRGETVPVVDLGDALTLPKVAGSTAPHALLVRPNRGEILGYAVERVLGQQEIVVRPLVDPLVASPAISGSTDLGDGRATIVLDLLGLSAMTVAARRRGRAA